MTARAPVVKRKQQRVLDDVADTRARNPLFAGRCYLCGAFVRRSQVFCYTHSWAAGPAR